MTTKTVGHTPGPWNIARRGDGTRDLPILRHDGKVIAAVRDEGRLIDAKLIAAAPDMLRALRAIVSDCKEVLEGREQFDMAIMHGIVHGLASAAIAKAEGR